MERRITVLTAAVFLLCVATLANTVHLVIVGAR
jgi:hypothetical protein